MIDPDKYLKATKSYRKLTNVVADYTARRGLTPQQWLLLHIVKENPDSSLSFLGEELGVTAPLITDMTAKLEKGAYIKVKPSKSDSRSKLVSITEGGEAHL